MTLQQLIEEKIKEFKERFVYSEPYEDNLAFVKSGVIKAIDEFLVSLAKEAYQAGREEALEEMMKETKEKRQIEVEKMEKSSLVVDRMYHKGWIHAIDFFDEIVQFKKLKVNK